MTELFNNIHEQNKVCVCGISIKEVIELGKLGCPKCYEAFSPILKRFVEQMNCRHIGKRPKNEVVSILEQEMVQAALDGRFEDANILRNDIKRLRGNVIQKG